MGRVVMIIGLILVSFNCKSQKAKLTRTFVSTCVLHDEPSIIIYLQPEGTFRYKFGYLDEDILGTWEKSGNELILRSDFFKKDFLIEKFGKDKSTWPSTKFSDAQGVDKFKIKGKKMYRMGETGYEKTCYLKKV